MCSSLIGLVLCGVFNMVTEVPMPSPTASPIPIESKTITKCWVSGEPDECGKVCYTFPKERSDEEIIKIVEEQRKVCSKK